MDYPLSAALADQGAATATDPTVRPTPLAWRGGHYNRASLFRQYGFMRCGASLAEPAPVLLLGIALQRLFMLAGEPAERHRRNNPRYVYSVNFSKDRLITAGFDPLSGDVWVKDGLHNLSRPPFCFTSMYAGACRAGFRHFRIE